MVVWMRTITILTMSLFLIKLCNSYSIGHATDSDFHGIESLFSSRTVTDYDALHSVPDWLDTINMSKYADQFKGAGYEKLEHVCKITDGDLEKIGVKLIGHRNKISKSIKAMKDHYRKKRDSFV